MKSRDEDELEDDVDDRDAPDFEDEDEAPKAKVKTRSVSEDDEEEDEEFAPRSKKSKVQDEDKSETSKPKLVKKAKTTGNGQKGGKATMAKTEKKHRSPRRADWPYGDESLVGRIFNKAEKTGIAVKVARKMCEENKQAKTPSYWVLTDIRRGQWKTAAGLWKWDVDQKQLENGFLKVSNVRLVKTKAKAA